MNYDIYKNQLRMILNNVNKISSALNIKAIDEAVDEITSKLGNNLFYIAVLGQYKRGKSTFINYIIGGNILPTSVLPLTSVITKIFYSEKISVSVLLEDDTKINIELNELDQYCTETNNPKNIKHVNEIQIRYPFDFISRDTVLIDTPGIASVYKHNTEVTYDFANKSDAILFIVSADPPISDAERELLKYIHESAGKIFFLLNKADHVTESQLAELIAFNKSVISGILKTDDVTIYPISALTALEGRINDDNNKIDKSNIALPINDIENYLMKEKGAILVSRIKYGINRILSMAETYIKSSIKLKKMPLDEIEKRISSFSEFMDSIDTNKKETAILFKADIKKMMEDLDETLDSYKRKVYVKISDEIKSHHNEIRSFTRLKQENDLKQFVENIIINQFDPFRHEIEKDTNEKYKSLLNKYSGRLNNILDQIREESKKLFDIDFNYFRTPKGITADSEFRYKIGYNVDALEISPVYFTYLIPKPIAEKMILKRYLNQISDDIDRNLGRIRYDILRRLEESLRLYKTNLYEQIDSINAIVQKLVTDSIKSIDKESEAFNKEYSSYSALLDSIAGIKNDLEKIDEK